MANQEYEYEGIDQMLEAFPNLLVEDGHIFSTQHGSRLATELCYVSLRYRDEDKIDSPAFALSTLTAYAPEMLRLLRRLQADLGTDLTDKEKILNDLLMRIDKDIRREYDRVKGLADIGLFSLPPRVI